MADKKTLTPEEKKLAAEKHVDELVQKGLVALEEMRKLNQELHCCKSFSCCS